MQYFLNVRENTVLTFSMNPFKANGHIEYIDKTNPKGLVKLNFAISKIDVEEMRLIAEREYAKVDDNRMYEVFETFEMISTDLIAKGILTDTCIIVGISFYYNAALGIPTQNIRRYITPAGFVSYAFSNNGSTRNVNAKTKGSKGNGQKGKYQNPGKKQGKKPKETIVKEDKLTYTTDTGISEDVSEKVYDDAVHSEKDNLGRDLETQEEKLVKTLEDALIEAFVVSDGSEPVAEFISNAAAPEGEDPLMS